MRNEVKVLVFARGLTGVDISTTFHAQDLSKRIGCKVRLLWLKILKIKLCLYKYKRYTVFNICCVVIVAMNVISFSLVH